MIPKLIFKLLVNSLAVYLASVLIDGFTFSGNLLILAGIGAALTAFQIFLYPIVKIIAFPLMLLSFGLFGFIITGTFLWVLSIYLPELTINGIVPLFWGTLMLSGINILFSWI